MGMELEVGMSVRLGWGLGWKQGWSWGWGFLYIIPCVPRTLRPSPHRQTAPYWELTGKATPQTMECRAELVWRMWQERAWAAPVPSTVAPTEEGSAVRVGEGNSKGP